ncbi:MAG: right-handed parallel beta-helix repeat-containing protein [Clostridia bacterium]|nr:right-handed parallel beta-helix repeat-containing protein [Clostridia bacterium]
MKAFTSKNRPFLATLCLLVTLALAIPGIAFGEEEATAYSFTATVLSASEDKEVIPEGTAVDDGGAARIVTFGTVTKRWKEDKGVTSTEAAKNMGGGFLFEVKGNAEVTITVSSTGGDNTSAFAVVDESGTAIANAEGIGEVSGTGKQTFNYTLSAGTYRVVSPQSDHNRGVRVYSITVIDTPAPAAVIAEATHSFNCGSLTASEDKEAVAEGTILDDENLGYFTSSGNVVKRWKEDKGVTSVEVGKALSGCIVFTVTGKAEAVVVVSSNGGDNDSSVGIIDAEGSAVANAEGITSVHGTSKQSLTYSLASGTYRIVSPYDEVNQRGARVYSVTVTEEAAAAFEERAWEFRYFGVSTGSDRNVLIASGKGIEDNVSLGSALFNEDGTVQKKGGKFVADSPADGGSYYYTVIDPTATNFYFQADVTVDALNPTPDGQEGFALMVRDSLGEEGVSGNWMANLISVGATKLPYGGVNTSPESACTIGIRAYTGIRTPEASDDNDITATRYGWWTTEGTANRIEAGKTYRVSLEKTDSAYIASQYDPATGELIGSYTWYIPARDPAALSVSAYSDLDDPLVYQEGHSAYVSLVTARGLNATFSSIIFTTSPWNAEGWKPQPTVYRDLTASIAGGSTAAGEEYGLIFRTNADGMARIFAGETLISENVPVSAGAYCNVGVPLDGRETEVTVEFTPDPSFAFSAFEKLSSYDPVRLSVTVTRRALGMDGVIFVRPDGLEDNGGTGMEDAVDLQTALNYAAPGQTILLESGVYDLSGRELTVFRGRNGTADSPITLTTADGKFATLDFGSTGRGFKVWGDHWHISLVNVTGTKNGLPGMQLAGHQCVLERMNFFNNGTTGLQVSGSSLDDRSLWPSYNTVKNCTSLNNADSALEDADGFAAKLTTGEGNVFDGCVAAYNADDGWDLFAKVASGQIGAVTIRNSVTYMNGYIRVQPGGTAKEFSFAAVSCDDNGNLTFGESEIMEAGNGNGFKLGGSSMPGGHTLINSIAYENRAKGIDSNSCPDIRVYNCTVYNNGSYNVAMYTGNTSAETGFAASGVISFRTGGDIGEKLDLQKQPNSAVFGPSCYYWEPDKQQSVNTLGVPVSADWFSSLDTSAAPERREDGSIDMHGLLMLTDFARSEYGAGARGQAWGQREATIWVVGDSTASAFSDRYYLPREGWGEELSVYFNTVVYNLAHSGASSRDYTGMADYRTLLEGSALIPALGDADGDKFLIIGFGHNDEKTETARFTDPNGDYLTEGSFANSLYVNYILPAIERGVAPVVCTPIVRLTGANTPESYAGASGHVTSDVTIGGTVYPGGSYPQAILDMVRDLKAQGIDIEYIDLTSATLSDNVALGEDAKWLHAFTGAKYADDGVTLIPAGLDQTHTNAYGARVNAWLISVLSGETAPGLHAYSLGKDRPLYETYFAASVNPDYEVPNYVSPSDEQMAGVSWPAFTDADGRVWYGTVFGDVGGDNKISSDNFAAVIGDNGELTLSVSNNCGKIASGSDGMMFYCTKLPAGTAFTLTAKATVIRFAENNQVSFGLMARDDLYIDTYVATTMGDYVAAGSRNQGAIVNFGRRSGALIGGTPAAAVDLTEGAEVIITLTGTADGFTLTYGNETVSAGFDYPLTSVDPDNMYIGFYVVRNCEITFSDIHLSVAE